MNLDYYFPNMTEQERREESQHTSEFIWPFLPCNTLPTNTALQVHCLALIKNALMCQADTTILTMRWLDFSPIPAANWSTPRTCVDWSRIDDWTRNNWVNAKKDGRMVHPTFGE